jgi:DNA-binding CsgD family transcriptional regulator
LITSARKLSPPALSRAGAFHGTIRYRMVALFDALSWRRYGATVDDLRRDVTEATGQAMHERTVRRDLELFELLGLATRDGQAWKLATDRPQRKVASETAASLSSQQRTILRLLASGLSSAEIGQQLHVAATTVDTHRSRIRKRVGLTTPDALMRFALLAFGDAHTLR